MRCPLPTVNNALIARTPTSSTLLIGVRSRGLMGGVINGARVLTSSGICHLMGCLVHQALALIVHYQ